MSLGIIIIGWLGYKVYFILGFETKAPINIISDARKTSNVFLHSRNIVPACVDGLPVSGHHSDAWRNLFRLQEADC